MSIARRLRKSLLRRYIRWRYPRAYAVPGFTTVEERYTLARLAERQGGGVYVEVGSYLGASTCFLAEGLKRSARGGTLYCVDTWQNEGMDEGRRDTFAVFSANTAYVADVIAPLRGTSESVAAGFDQPVDLVFIDGYHTYDACSADIAAWLPKLRPGGVMIFHDVTEFPGVGAAVHEHVAPRARHLEYLPNMAWAVL